MHGFDTPVTLTGPLRSPAQLLDDQTYGGHASVHDEATAASLGLAGAPIEGPTHFSQFDPLAAVLWGAAWFERGCLSVHFQTMVVAGEEVVATMVTTAPDAASVQAHKADGTPVLTGTASLGPEHPPSELEARRSRQSPPGPLFIVDQLEVGATGDDVTAAMSWDAPNGDLYPFSLARKVATMTEPSPWYTPQGATTSPWGRPVVPFEMISVLANKTPSAFPVRGPSLGLFLDLEVRLVDGPVFVDEAYRVARRVVGLGESRRTESYWTETTISEERSGRHVATVLLHQGVFKDSYAGYPRQAER